MAIELLVNVTPQETRVALVENGVLQEVRIERSRTRGLVGNIYLGRVVRVLPGMGAAFVEVGLERTAFLHVNDIVNGNDSNGAIDDSGGGAPAIGELLREGQQLVVQVAKEPLGQKGARLTTQLSLASRYLVFMPRRPLIGVSQRIDSPEERARLRELVTRLAPQAGCAPEAERPAAPADAATLAATTGGGYIVRTAAEGVGEAELAMDIEFLQRLWGSVRERLPHARAPELVYEDLPLVLRTVRDLATSDIEKVRIDSRETSEHVRAFCTQFVPELAGRVEHYPGERPILDLYSVEDEVQRALQRRVELKSGGHLVIDQTEAMTTIDVNTGAYVGRRNLAETIFKTNLEAAQAIARQLRLRNLGGIIIVDFIDMTDSEHQRQVLRALEKALERDHARTSVSEVTSLGLVQITRKRTRESLEHVLCEPCPVCNGSGTLKTAETVCYEIMREIIREARQFDAQRLLVIAAPRVVERMLDEESRSVAELEAFIGRPIQFQSESGYSPDQYDVVIL